MKIIKLKGQRPANEYEKYLIEEGYVCTNIYPYLIEKQTFNYKFKDDIIVLEDVTNER